MPLKKKKYKYRGRIIFWVLVCLIAALMIYAPKKPSGEIQFVEIDLA